MGVKVFVEEASWLDSGPAVEDALDTSLVAGVEVTHVGQGDCTAILVETEDGRHRPAVYLDFGGGCGKCAKTHPDQPGFSDLPTRFRLELAPKVLLTHWDKDHYFSASKLEAARRLDWLAPRQRVGPQCVRFVEELDSIHCFPTGVTQIAFTLGAGAELFVERVEPKTEKAAEDNNLCGLAFTLVKKDDNGTARQRIVMTGDAPYQFVSSLAGPSASSPGGEIVGLFAFHHGSKTHLVKTTRTVELQPAEEHTLVFTYGLDSAGRNAFGHPAEDALRLYWDWGWRHRVNTASERPDTPKPEDTGHSGDAGHREVLFR